MQSLLRGCLLLSRDAIRAWLARAPLSEDEEEEEKEIEGCKVFQSSRGDGVQCAQTQLFDAGNSRECVLHPLPTRGAQPSTSGRRVTCARTCALEHSAHRMIGYIPPRLSRFIDDFYEHRIFNSGAWLALFIVAAASRVERRHVSTITRHALTFTFTFFYFFYFFMPRLAPMLRSSKKASQWPFTVSRWNRGKKSPLLVSVEIKRLKNHVVFIDG